MNSLDSGLIAINGQIFEQGLAKISPLDKGFLFGDSVFEVLVAFGRKVLDLGAHLERLRRSAEMIRLDIPWSNEEIAFEVAAMVEQANFKKAYIRIVVTRGVGIGIDSESSPSRVTYCLPAKTENSQVYEDGISLKLCKKTSNKRGPSAKTANYLNSIVAVHDAKKDGYDDILWVNSDGEVTESSTSNIFFIGRIGDLVEIATPPPKSGLLLGITRQIMVDLLNRSQIPVTERIIYEDEIPRFDEAFVSSTVRGLVPIKKIGNHRLNSSRPKSVFNQTKRLHKAWVDTQLGFHVDWRTGEIINYIDEKKGH